MEVWQLKGKPSPLITALQTAKTELEKANNPDSGLYRLISKAIYDLEVVEQLPSNWRDAI